MSRLFIKKYGKTGIFEPSSNVFRIDQKSLGSVFGQYSLPVQHSYFNFDNFTPLANSHEVLFKVAPSVSL